MRFGRSLTLPSPRKVNLQTMAKVLVTGGSGMLGSYVAAQASGSGWETWATYCGNEVSLPGCKVIRLDIGDASQVERTIADIRPDAIIHTAALVQPDLCEQRKADAFRTNVLGTYNIASAASKYGVHLVHISTDMVFYGEDEAFKDDAPVKPSNYYGMTKASAEAAVQAVVPQAAILRTTVIYGPRMFENLLSFSDNIINSLKDGREVKAFIDQYRSPIPAWNLADVSLEIAERRLSGIFQAVCPDLVTRFQFAEKIAEVFGLNADLIIPISMDDVQAIARRPKVLTLDILHATQVLGTRLLTFDEGIAELKQRME